jgi:signal transduction protein with GAF and PtsI domain
MEDLERHRNETARRLESGGDLTASLCDALDGVLAAFGCAVGTIHRVSSQTGRLELVVHRGIPDAILDRVRDVPIGKGMAGLAAERREPVQVCNLQSDTSGQAKPAAKQTGMEGSIAVPMLVNGELCGVLGVAKPTVYEFSEAEKTELMEIARMIGQRVGS